MLKDVNNVTRTKNVKNVFSSMLQRWCMSI